VRPFFYLIVPRDSYVRTTVFLATVLVLMGISHRFEIKSIRTWPIVLALVLLSFGILRLCTLLRILNLWTISSVTSLYKSSWRYALNCRV